MESKTATNCKNREENGGYQGLVGRGTKEILFKGTHLQLVINKTERSNANDYRQQYCMMTFKGAKRLPLNCFHHKKEITVMGLINVS